MNCSDWDIVHPPLTVISVLRMEPAAQTVKRRKTTTHTAQKAFRATEVHGHRGSGTQDSHLVPPSRAQLLGGDGGMGRRWGLTV